MHGHLNVKLVLYHGTYLTGLKKRIRTEHSLHTNQKCYSSNEVILYRCLLTKVYGVTCQKNVTLRPSELHISQYNSSHYYTSQLNPSPSNEQKQLNRDTVLYISK